MPKVRTGAVITGLSIDADASAPAYRQLYLEIRRLILEGTLRPGARVPSTRTLAGDLGLSRTTIVAAFDQLALEGFLTRRVGDGTYVAPREALPAPPAGARSAPSPSPAPAPPPRGNRPFALGPALDAFPIRIWQKVVARRARALRRHDLAWADPAGYAPLRRAIVEYAGTSRGVRCDPDQVIILPSSQLGIDLTIRVLLRRGDRILFENPGYRGAREAFVAAGMRIATAPIDDEGLNVGKALRRAPAVRLAYVTPSHQFPLGPVLSLPRRTALLSWAESRNAWILEDDYDSEFRYRGRPIASLQSIDAAQRVVYLSTFSLVMYRALRLAYTIVPPGLVDAFLSARRLLDGHCPWLPQAALADFIAEGHFGGHVRKMRALYAERQEHLLAASRARLSGLCDVSPSDAGMHLVGRLPDGADDAAISRLAAARGVVAGALSAYDAGRGRRRGLLLGYAAHGPAEIRRGVAALAEALAQVPSTRG